MEASSLVVNFAIQDTDVAESSVLLEQEAYDPNVGNITQLDLVEKLAEILYDADEPDVDCGVDYNSELYTNILAYPYPKDLNFDTGITYGDIEEIIWSEVSVTDYISYELTTSSEAEYPIHEFISAEWIQPVFDGLGEVVAPPTDGITVSNRTIDISEPVYGILKVNYLTARRIHLIHIDPREDAIENVYQSWLYARWEGGVELTEIDAPDNAEENYLNNSTCEGGDSVIFEPPDPPGVPIARPVNHSYTIDYCTREVSE